MFWYCHKRGREVRLEREAKVDSDGRIVELPDDPLLQSSPSSPNSLRPKHGQRAKSHDQRAEGRERRDRDGERRTYSDDGRGGGRRHGDWRDSPRSPKERREREMTSLEIEREEARRKEERVHERAEERIKRHNRDSRPTSSRRGSGSGERRRRRRSDEEYASTPTKERR